MNREQKIWLFQVDHEMKARYGIDHIDAGWSPEDIERFHAFEMPPQNFVDWFGSKYGLAEKDDWSLARRQVHGSRLSPG